MKWTKAPNRKELPKSNYELTLNVTCNFRYIETPKYVQSSLIMSWQLISVCLAPSWLKKWLYELALTSLAPHLQYLNCSLFLCLSSSPLCSSSHATGLTLLFSTDPACSLPRTFSAFLSSHHIPLCTRDHTGLGLWSVPHSTLIREASSCRRWELTQRPTTRQCAERQRVWMSPRKQHLPDTAGLMYIWIHRDCGHMHRTAQVQVRWDPSAERGKRAWIPPLTKKLTAIDFCLQREKWFSPMASHWVLRH